MWLVPSGKRGPLTPVGEGVGPDDAEVAGCARFPYQSVSPDDRARSHRNGAHGCIGDRGGRNGLSGRAVGELRDDGRAVLLVDHNVKSVSRLVNRVLAMYVGERIAEGSADEVMRNETVRRVYLGGSIEIEDGAPSSWRPP